VSGVDVVAVLRRDATAAAIDRQWDDDAEERSIESAAAIAAVAELIEAGKNTVTDLRKHAKQVHDLPLLQQDLRRLANKIERRLANVGPQS
jgi:predicted homoserine dehydrogenase-like protein